MHDAVSDGLRRGKDLKADFDAINETDAETVILSCEGFDDLKVGELERLQSYIGGYPVQIVYYARRWSDRVPSDWRQRVMMGQYATFPEYYIRFLNNPEGTGEINYSIVWETFEKVFGRQSLSIVSFNNLVDRGVDLFKHFCEAIVGLAATPQVVQGLVQKNESPDMIDTEILRVINYLYYLETSQVNKVMRVKFHKLKERYDLSSLREHMQSDIREIKLKDNAVPLRTTWEAISAYQDRLVSPEYGKQIFELRDVQMPFVGQNYLFRPDAIDEVRRLYLFVAEAQVESPELQ